MDNTNGFISYDDFQRMISNFVQVSHKHDDGWYLQKQNDIEYLVKRVFNVPKTLRKLGAEPSLVSQGMSTNHKSWRSNEDRLPQSVIANMEFENDNDDQCICGNTSDERMLSYEYHIIFSESYSVPVLYVNISEKDGSLLQLKDVWKLCPDVYQSHIQGNKWTTLTQQEHPLLGRPFLQLHPCQTSELMAKLKKSFLNIDCSSCGYLVVWLSTVGPLVGLELPHFYIGEPKSE